MEAHAVKTRIVRPGDNIEEVIAESIPHLEERSVLVIASKIFSFCENRLVPKTTNDKNEKWELAKQEADLWLDPDESIYQCMLTIKGNWMFANAGIDESNAEGDHYALWPKDPQKSINRVWQFLRQHYGLKEVGVIMSDSRGLPMSWGVTGHAIAHCGFQVLYSYIGKPDIYGRLMQMERINMSQSIVVAGTLVMGEGDEQTPMAIVTDIPKISFDDHEPTLEELVYVKVSMKDDIYAPLINRAPWQKGGGGIK